MTPVSNGHVGMALHESLLVQVTASHLAAPP
jgi:hypothetical protein